MPGLSRIALIGSAFMVPASLGMLLLAGRKASPCLGLLTGWLLDAWPMPLASSPQPCLTGQRHLRVLSRSVATPALIAGRMPWVAANT